MEASRNQILTTGSNSKFFELNESHSSMNEGSRTNLPQIIPEKDQNNNFAQNSNEKSEIFSDPTLDYIRQYLLEENIDGEIGECQEAALKDIEKLFYDILGEKYPPSQDKQLLSIQSKGNPNFTDCKDQVGPSFNESLKQLSGIENLLTSEFHRGVEEGMKFLPNFNQLSIDLEVSKLKVDPMKKGDGNFRLGEKKENGLLHKHKGKTSSNNADLDLLEGRNCKIPMVACEETIRDAIFDKVLLNCEDNYEREETSNLDETTEPEANCRNKDKNKDHHVNMRALLIACADAININDIKVASELTKKIRKYASPIGDGIQRLAYVFVLGLEARLAGTGSEILRRFVARRVSSNESLKTYDMIVRTSPFFRVAYHFANKSILTATGAASKIHIVDFGIGFGFQWPSLIQALAKMKDGPSRLRITGVDFPQPGFHPDERIKLTGKRLADYARDFGVPFEYHGIASQWESISSEDLNIRDDEVLVVNIMYTSGKLKDEILFGKNKSKDQLLNSIRAIQPKVFIHGILNLSFSPYFVPRFRMVLLQYSRFFDMLDTFVPPNSKPRQLMEFELFGPPIINQIACEGSDLVTILETYKQCHKRNLETGFEQLPMDPSVLKECCKMVRNGYNKGFFVEEDCNWFLQGWKVAYFKITAKFEGVELDHCIVDFNVIDGVFKRKPLEVPILEVWTMWARDYCKEMKINDFKFFDPERNSGDNIIRNVQGSLAYFVNAFAKRKSCYHVAIHQNVNHYVVVIALPVQKKMWIVDSLNDDMYDSPIIKACNTALKRIRIADRFDIDFIPSPRQPNGTDCEYYAMRNLQLILFYYMGYMMLPQVLKPVGEPYKDEDLNLTLNDFYAYFRRLV